MMYQNYTTEFGQVSLKLSLFERNILYIIKYTKDTFKPYKSTRQILRDLIGQPVEGFVNTIRGTLHLLLIPFILLSFLAAPFKRKSFAAQQLKKLTSSVKMRSLIALGVFQIALWPLNILRMPLRGILTWLKGAPKIEDSESLQVLATQHEKITEDTELAKQSRALTAGVFLEKFANAIKKGQKTQITENEGKKQQFQKELDALHIPMSSSGQPVVSAKLEGSTYLLSPFDYSEDKDPDIKKIVRINADLQKAVDNNGTILIRKPKDNSIRLFHRLTHKFKSKDLPILKNQGFANLTFPNKGEAMLQLPQSNISNEMACEIAAHNPPATINPPLDKKWIQENKDKDFSSVMTFFQRTFAERKTEITSTKKMAIS